MTSLSFRNAHEALPVLLDRMLKLGVEDNSRNGPVLRLDGPTLICYERPMERVVFWAERDANPFFHLMEAMWMLAGREDAEFLTQYVSRMKDYSDNGKTFNGAYGKRWRSHFGHDQLDVICGQLGADPQCRRQVLQMWDARADQRNPACRDLPCNTHCYFSIHEGRLDMTVCNRSNDLLWGCLGANVVHFSVLQEYMAERIGVPVGRYYQFTNNLHAYKFALDGGIEQVTGLQGLPSPYELGEVRPWPLALGTGVAFKEDLKRLDVPQEYESEYFRCVVGPAQKVHKVYKLHGPEAALPLCAAILAADWRMAATEWLQRRVQRRERAKDDGVRYDEVMA